MIFRKPQPFEYEGTDTGVVLLHAYTGSPNDMNFMARALQRSGYGVYVPLFFRAWDSGAVRYFDKRQPGYLVGRK